MNKQEKFQIKLALIVFLLTIVSSLISGYLVYELTKDKEPFLIISPYQYNPYNNTLSIQITNIKEAPAIMISVFYRIEEVDDWQVENPIEIPYLGKIPEYVNINLNKLDNQIVQYCERLLIESGAQEADSFELGKDFNVLLKIQCKNCNNNFLQTSQITYTQNIKCRYNPNKEGISYEFGSTSGVGF